MIPQDFANWTREQRKEFDLIKGLAFQLTPEEQEKEEKKQHRQLVEIVQSKLAPYGIEFTGKEKDTSTLWELYLKGDGTEANKPMNERLGSNEKLDQIINDKKTRREGIKEFMNFVLQYES